MGVALSIGLLLTGASTGCDELSARRGIQKGDKAFKASQYRDAVKEYEAALKKSDLTIGHHNAGMAYFRLFENGAKASENKEHAEKATAHFLHYLKSSPNDKKVIDMVTKIWLDADQHQKALDYWTKVLANDPNDPGVLARLADINTKAGNHKEAIEWFTKRVAAEKDDIGRVRGYTDIASVQYSRLLGETLVDEERLAVADSALVALHKATQINPDNARLYGITAGVYGLRANAHGASWARTVDLASKRYFNLLALEKSKSASKPKPKSPDKDKSDKGKKPKPDGQK